MSRVKQFLAALAVIGMFAAPVTNAYASSVSFNKYTFKTYSYTESFYKVTSRVKPDGEQRWYMTLTKVTGVPSTASSPIAVSVKSEKQIDWADPLYVKTGSQSKAYSSELGVKKGTRCYLYMSGNGNAKTGYTVTVSGRYSS